MKVYTGFGDQGNTSLFDLTVVKKNSIRVDAYGTVDELSAFLGQARFLSSDRPDIQKELEQVQIKLFTVAAELATENREKLKETITEETVRAMENTIDTFTKEIEGPFRFVLSGANAASSALHVARTVCRRAERRILDLKDTGAFVNPALCVYVNRISDLLYVFARIFENKSLEE